MEKIIPDIIEANVELFKNLEKKGIIERFIKGKESIDLARDKFNVEKRYSTDEKFGGHKLICVNFNLTKVNLNYHQEKEDFILINDCKKYKRLYLLVSLLKKDDLEKKISNQKLCAKDFLIIKLKFNHPLLSFFTMNKYIPHCELVKSENSELNPYFFVTEPTKLENISINTNKYNIIFED